MIVANRTQVVPGNPLKADPTRTATLRRVYEQDVSKRYNALKYKIVKLLLSEDAFGFKSHQQWSRLFMFNAAPTVNRRWAFHTDSQKVEEFGNWLEQEYTDPKLGVGPQAHDAYYKKYTQAGYDKGQGRAFDDTRKPYAQGYAQAGQSVSDFYAGTRYEFLQSSFGRAVSIDKVKLLAQRTYTDIKGVNEVMATRLQRSLTDGLTQGKNPIAIARDMRKVVDISKRQAKMVARTEVIRAHAEGQLDAMERLGVDEVGVMVEWSTAGDDRVCPLCSALDGVVLKIKEARGIIPRHPNCLPGDSLVTSSSAIAAASKRWFDGNLIVIKTASGRKLSCTPNHPILTDCGWVSAEQLDSSCKIVCDGNSEWENILDGLDQDIIPSIHNVAESVFRSSQVSAVPVPLTAEDFHGDSADGQIAVIGADRRLLEHFQSPLTQGSPNPYLQGGNTKQPLLAGSSPQGLNHNAISLTAPVCVCGRRLTPASSRAHSRPLEGFSLRSSTHHNAGILQPSVNNPTANLQLIRQSVTGLPSNVFLDDIVSIDQRPVNCHVYNLQTEYEWYTANGIITHNCRCAHIPANVGESHKGQFRTKQTAQARINESIRREIPKRSKRTLARQKELTTWGGADTKLTKVRPTERKALFRTTKQGKTVGLPTPKEPVKLAPVKERGSVPTKLRVSSTVMDKKILSALSKGEQSVNQIAKETGINVSKVVDRALKLEEKGKVIGTDGGWSVVRGKRRAKSVAKAGDTPRLLDSKTDSGRWLKIRSSYSSVSKESRAEFAQVSEEVIENLNTKSLSRVENVTIKFHESPDSIDNYIFKVWGEEPSGFANTSGLYIQDTAEIHSGTKGWVVQLGPEAVKDSRRGTFAHELSHAIDFASTEKAQLSSSVAWRKAWKAEGFKGKLSDYAMESPLEAFAEFGRAMFGSSNKVRQATIAENPLSYAFWKKKGLL